MKICDILKMKIDGVRNFKLLSNMKEQLEKEIEQTLPGKLKINKRKNGIIQHYYRVKSTEKNGKYIQKSNKETLMLYAQKEYNQRVLKIINENIDILKQFVEKMKVVENEIYAVYDSFPNETKQYITPIEISDDQFVKKWCAQSYKINDGWPNEKQYKTDKGDMVRTKGEEEIANKLFQKGIFYRYECKLKLRDGTIYYPDFMILDEVNRKIIIWEHMGMRDNPEYEENAVEKLNTYLANGFFVGYNLIVTQENLKSKFNTELLEKTIHQHLGHLVKNKKT